MSMRNPRLINSNPWILHLLGALVLGAGCTGSAKSTGSSTPSKRGRSYPGFGEADKRVTSYERAKDGSGSPTAAEARRTRPSPSSPTTSSYGARRSYGAAQQSRRGEGRVAPRSQRIYRQRQKKKEATPGERPGLATRAGEHRHSPVEKQSFFRATPNRPWGAAAIRYNNLAGLYAQVKHRVRYTRCATCAGGLPALLPRPPLPVAHSHPRAARHRGLGGRRPLAAPAWPQGQGADLCHGKKKRPIPDRRAQQNKPSL